MAFASSTFIMAFLPAFLAAYFVLPMRGWRNAVLLVFSLLFYAWGDPAHLALLAAAIALTALLAWGTYELNKQPVISEPEEYSLVDGVATIPFSQVEDGHLHRFAYTAADGTEMRFIIILKNGGAYGVGLDACETCGDAGYYEQDGKIICKRCDVAINLATIGFKGGCNPIPFPYQVDDGAIIIHAADLDALSAHFQ